MDACFQLAPEWISYHVSKQQMQTVDLSGAENGIFKVTSSIHWLLISWLLPSPGHQQPFYWLDRKNKSFFLRRGILAACDISILRNDKKMLKYFWFFLQQIQHEIGHDVAAYIMLQTVKLDDTVIYWGTPDNMPPPSTPVCGFTMELCPVDNTGAVHYRRNALQCNTVSYMTQRQINKSRIGHEASSVSFSDEIVTIFR